MHIEIQFTPKQSEFDRAVEKYPYTCYAGSKGSGKSAGLRLIMLKRRILYPGSTGYIFRKTYAELERNHITPLLQQFSQLQQYYSATKKGLFLPNGSQLRFAFVEHKNQLTKFQGLDTDDLAIEEAGEWQFEHFEYLDTQKRSAKEGISPRTLLTGNPGGIGHQWIKRLFVQRKFRVVENPNHYYYVRAMVEDNPFIMKNDPDYVRRLEAISNETLRRAFRYGDWDIQAGQYFSEFSRDVHVVEPFKIPIHWKWFGAYDYGYNHPAAWLFFVTDEDGNVYLVHEIVKAQMRIDEQAKIVHEFISKMIETNQKKDKSIVFEAGHDCWAKKKASDPTIAEDFSKLGVVMRRANIDRKLGASQVRMYLAHDPKTDKRPRLFIFKNCEITIDCISRMIHNPSDIEDVLKVDSVDGDPWTGDDCFVAGTKVTTIHGLQNIEDITPGTLVLTRAGWRPVARTWCSRLDAITAEVKLSNGQSIVGTLNHPIWTGREFTRLERLKSGQVLSLDRENEWLFQRQSSSMVSSSDDTHLLSNRAIRGISVLAEITASEVLALCITKYGSRFTDQFHRATTFITKTGIHSTTILATWYASVLRSMLGLISLSQEELNRVESKLNGFVRWQAPGIALMLAESGIADTGERVLRNERARSLSVNSVMENLIHFVQRELSSVLLSAKQDTGAPQSLITSRSNAQYVEHNSRQINSRDREHAPVVVDFVREVGVNRTFALHVRDCHEYYANGVLVKNCYDSFRYGLMSRPIISVKPKPKRRTTYDEAPDNRPSWQTV